MSSRCATRSRRTAETAVQVKLNLDGTGQGIFNTGVPFFEHMLDQVARHGLFDLEIMAEGDLHIDAHHTVEDVGITLGQAFAEALGEKRGIRRYGFAYVPLDEALSRVVVDCSGRAHLVYGVTTPASQVGNFEVELVREFFQGFVNHAMLALHVDTLRGANTHHLVESVFKAFGRALRAAVEQDVRLSDSIPSTKASL